MLDGLPLLNVVSWNALITGYAHVKQSLDYYEEMRREGILPDAVTYPCILKAFGPADKGETNP